MLIGAEGRCRKDIAVLAGVSSADGRSKVAHEVALEELRLFEIVKGFQELHRCVMVELIALVPHLV